MVTIVRPHSTYGAYNDSSAFTLEWSCDISGQSGYEIYYKLSTSDSWLSTGKITSTSTTYDLSNIYNLLGIDFTEITYKVKIYYSTTNTQGLLTGTEESDIYTIVFRQPASGYLKIYDGKETQSYPLFNTIDNTDLNKLNIKNNSGKFVTPLLNTESPIASELKIKVGNDNKAIASNYATDLTYTVNTTPGTFDQQAYTNAYAYRYDSGKTSSTYYYYVKDSDTYSTKESSYGSKSYYYKYDYYVDKYYYRYVYNYQSSYYYSKIYKYDSYSYAYKYSKYANPPKVGYYYAFTTTNVYYTYWNGGYTLVNNSYYYTTPQSVYSGFSKVYSYASTSTNTVVGYYYNKFNYYYYYKDSGTNYSYYYYSTKYSYNKNYTYRYFT